MNNSTPTNSLSNNLLKKVYNTLLETSDKLNICSLSIISSKIASYGQIDYEKRFINELPQDLNYLKKNEDVRNNPSLILENCQNVISIALSYKLGLSEQNIDINNSNQGNISIYARGRDYHKTVKKKLEYIGLKLQDIIPDLKYRAITDSVPFYEQFFAQIGNLGFRGKNQLIRIPHIGSMVFLGELLINKNLINNEIVKKIKSNENIQDSTIKINFNCPLNCKNCIYKCPTNALQNHGININKCISFLTIENKGIIPLEFWKKIGNKIYGCDECQWHCPFNKPLYEQDSEIDFKNRYDNQFLNFFNLLKITNNDFKKIFAGSPILRIGYENFMRNIVVASTNSENKIKLLPLIINLKGISPKLDWHIEQAEKIIRKN
ncbi:MAG: tRNA epoxyqueuosine(34) reductase QueG [Succinivibrionaceae bacterium]